MTRIALEELESLIYQRKYFVLHAPRQTGKTSCLLALHDYLNARGEFYAVYANVEVGQASRGGRFKLAPWDWRYYAEKLKKEKYGLNETEISQYFPLEEVRKGAFYVANKLYGLTFEQLDNLPLPHPEALAFEVKDADGKHIGIYYADYFPRAR